MASLRIQKLSATLVVGFLLVGGPLSLAAPAPSKDVTVITVRAQDHMLPSATSYSAVTDAEHDFTLRDTRDSHRRDIAEMNDADTDKKGGKSKNSDAKKEGKSKNSDDEKEGKGKNSDDKKEGKSKNSDGKKEMTKEKPEKAPEVKKSSTSKPAAKVAKPETKKDDSGSGPDIKNPLEDLTGVADVGDIAETASDLLPDVLDL